ncbi:high affinity immunoglobulin epsilon receptor subunit alpha [Orycteropus afer afer]|uniref:high affinity immunoglobulin epsilon receptor subunit alpha n=1 Tax=Orycteropus afer afer TaxID=1230840 RepID=UPI001C5CC12F|nr:high affinity immunoglobulin epsilon receptor subunit alpha [Orycteropus afer afer]
MPAPVGSLVQLWIVLLLFSPVGVLAATQKSTISLDPPWNRIFRGESVKLICNRHKSPEVTLTRWFHNDTILSKTNSSLDITNAGQQDSGEYTCQNGKYNLSKPVFLEVFSDWLLLQVSADVVTEGKPLFIRCHSWKNWYAYKVIYYKDGKAFKYWYENHNISIAKATLKDNGTYHCEGSIQKLKHTSNSVTITIKTQINNHWIQFFVQLLVVILFTVDTGLFILTQQQFKLFLEIKRTGKGNKRLDPKCKLDFKEK